MSDIQLLVENIQTVLAFPETVAPDLIRQYARDYAEACTELNRQMQNCIIHIRKGNNAEAIRLAEMEKPSIPEKFLLLDFAERDEWVEIVSTLGYDIPPALPVEQSKELNDAYLKASPLEPLLKEYRFYALNNSPLKERLKILRTIARIDSQNLFWHDDQEKFEKVRIEELNNEIKDAIASKNLSLITSLHQELSSPDWIITPPMEYRQLLCTHVLQNYAEILLQNYAEFNYPQAMQVYTSMQQILATNSMSMPANIQQTIRSAVNWIGETQKQNDLQKMFNQRSVDLQKAIEIESPKPILERLYYELTSIATQGGLQIATELDELYKSRIDELELRASRSIKIIVLAIICVCILFAGLLGWGLVMQHNKRLTNEVIANLQQIENDKKIDEIDGTIKRIEKNMPKIAKSPEVIKLVTRLQNILQEDEKRAKEFERYYSQATASLDINKKLNFTELQSIKVSIDQAKKLARTTPEQTQLTELESKYDTAFSIRKIETETDFSNKLTEISNAFAAIKQNNKQPNDKIFTQTKELSNRIEELLLSTQYIDAKFKERSKNLLDQITKYETDIDKQLKQDAAFKNFIAATSWTNYQSALKDFVKNFPDHYAVSDINEVLNELVKISKVSAQVYELADTYKKNMHDYNLLQKEAPELAKKIKELSANISGSVKTIFSPEQAIIELDKMKPFNQESLKSSEALLKIIVKRDLYPWIKDDKWYYLTKKPTKETSTYYYVTSFAADSTTSDRKTFPIVEKMFDEYQYKLNGTQQQYAIETLKKIDAIKDNSTDVICNLMEELLSENYSGLDPILKCVLLDLFIADISKIDPIFATHFAQYHKIIQGSGLDIYTNWMDVNSNDTKRQREIAKSIIKRLLQIKELSEKTRNDKSKFKNSIKIFQPSFRWIGFLSKKDGVWNCLIKSNVRISKTGDVYILRLKSTDNKLIPIKIGKVVESQIQLNDSETLWLQCSPVFIIQQ